MQNILLCIALNAVGSALGVYVSIKYVDSRINAFIKAYMPPMDELQAARKARIPQTVRLVSHG